MCSASVILGFTRIMAQRALTEALRPASLRSETAQIIASDGIKDILHFLKMHRWRLSSRFYGHCQPPFIKDCYVALNFLIYWHTD